MYTLKTKQDQAVNEDLCVSVSVYMKTSTVVSMVVRLHLTRHYSYTRPCLGKQHLKTEHLEAGSYVVFTVLPSRRFSSLPCYGKALKY